MDGFEFVFNKKTNYIRLKNVNIIKSKSIISYGFEISNEFSFIDKVLSSQ